MGCALSSVVMTNKPQQGVDERKGSVKGMSGVEGDNVLRIVGTAAKRGTPSFQTDTHRPPSLVGIIARTMGSR